MQPDRKSWTYGRAPNAIDILQCSLTCLSKHRQGANLFIRLFRETAPFSRLLRTLWIRRTHSRLNPRVPTGAEPYPQRLSFWVSWHGARQDDITIYTRVGNALTYKPVAVFGSNYKEMSGKWSSPREAYFDGMMQTLKRKACRFVLGLSDVYYPFSGITNNVAESINAVRKKLREWKEAPIDGILINYYLLSFYKLEIPRPRKFYAADAA